MSRLDRSDLSGTDPECRLVGCNFNSTSRRRCRTEDILFALDERDQGEDRQAGGQFRRGAWISSERASCTRGRLRHRGEWCSPPARTVSIPLRDATSFHSQQKRCFPSDRTKYASDNESLEVVGGAGTNIGSRSTNRTEHRCQRTRSLIRDRLQSVQFGQFDFNGGSAIGNSEPAAVIHNPNATSPLTFGFLPCDDEYAARHLSEDELLFERIGPKIEQSGT